MINLTIDNRVLFGFILVVAIFNFILFISMVKHRVKYRRLFKSYDNFMAGKSAKNLEDIIILLRKDIRSLKSESRLNRDAIRELNRLERNCLQKMGILKYDAFEGMGGKLSFALCLLDYRNSGYIINSIHSRETTFNYIKIVENGQTDQVLTDEEKIKMCEIVTKAGADYIKTSTGFSTVGATFDDVKLFSKHVGKNVKIKAAGGIASLDDAYKFLELGADRLGTSRIVKLVKGQEATGY